MSLPERLGESRTSEIMAHARWPIVGSVSAALVFGALAYLGPAGIVVTGGARDQRPGGGMDAFSYSAPNTPSVDAVVFAPTGDSLRVMGSAFVGSGDAAHDSTQIQVDTTGGDFSNPQYHNASLGAVTTDTVAALDSGAVVDVRMRYKADPNKGEWSGWDTLTSVQMVYTGAEPAYDAAVHDLIFFDDFDSFDAFSPANGDSAFLEKYPFGVVNCTGCGDDVDFQGAGPGEDGDETEDLGVVIISSPGFGGTGNALRLTYADTTTQASEIIIGPGGPTLNEVGELGDGLPEVVRPYDHFFYTVRFRTSVGADPVCANNSSVKGWMFPENNDGSTPRIEWRPLGLRPNFGVGTGSGRWDGTNGPGDDDSPRWGLGGGWHENKVHAITGDTVDIWTTTADMPWITADEVGYPPAWGQECGADPKRFNDGEWHTFTIEIRSGTSWDNSQKGQRLWFDGHKVFDDVGRVPLITDAWGQGVGNAFDGTAIGGGDGGLLTTHAQPTSGALVWGLFPSGVPSGQPEFWIEFDDWRAWTPK